MSAAFKLNRTSNNNVHLKCVFDIIDLRYKFVTLTLIFCRRII